MRPAGVILRGRMASQSLIADSIREDLPAIVAGWRAERGGEAGKEEGEALSLIHI